MLYHHSANGNHLGQVACFSSVMHRKYVSRQGFTTSIWTSVCGWYDEDKHKETPSFFNNSLQKVLMNMESRSLTILFDKPLNRYFSSTKTYAIKCVLYGWVKVQKWLYFDNRSTTTNITSFLFDLGNLVMKSMETSVKRACDTGRA